MVVFLWVVVDCLIYDNFVIYCVIFSGFHVHVLHHAWVTCKFDYIDILTCWYMLIGSTFFIAFWNTLSFM